MQKIHSRTPLYKLLKHLKITQETLAGRLQIRQSSLSRMAKGQISISMAARIVDAVDPGRLVITELHLLYPERYTRWEPPAPATAD